MKLYLMRHGEAGFDAPSDELRALTPVGQSQCQSMAQQLSDAFAEVELVLVSPYLRARQTWGEIADYCPNAKVIEIVDELVPESDPALSASIIKAYASVKQLDKVLVVAHMPLLGFLLSELLPGQEPLLFATASVTELQLGQQAQIVNRYLP
ncbi:phosphohistidine phosphatase SixA [Ferrimonas senticii]|uniref:phosphohistidine phosphatase SixA n=1 Tax=Ferrimonas senticii TaxID=394566 RepID=UPI0003FCCE77|nr:phosphohistidine phosphatase SixA [Ferrimonas senticii]